MLLLSVYRYFSKGDNGHSANRYSSTVALFSSLRLVELLSDFYGDFQHGWPLYTENEISESRKQEMIIDLLTLDLGVSSFVWKRYSIWWRTESTHWFRIETAGLKWAPRQIWECDGRYHCDHLKKESKKAKIWRQSYEFLIRILHSEKK